MKSVYLSRLRDRFAWRETTFSRGKRVRRRIDPAQYAKIHKELPYCTAMQ
ncbi:hypothetical protein BSU04_13175 [Caballeronia sordidicola]|uniref:Uncharacterized protein n=1 Tax=Caballeronia sordidicola TaxID=196367 RepID=A0A226X5G6_CABSO|nr:hypothetical protein BSU04_13175 [Caballeronia sordidicola]